MCSYAAVASHILRWRSYSESMWHYFFGIAEAIKRVCRTSSASPRKHACQPAWAVPKLSTRLSTLQRLLRYSSVSSIKESASTSVSGAACRQGSSYPPALCCKDERSHHTEIVTGRISKQSRLSQCSRQERPGDVATLYDQGP